MTHSGPAAPEGVLPFADLVEDAVTEIGEAGPVLLGAQCASCGCVWFPTRPICPRCAENDVTPYRLGPRGTLYSYTTVHVSSARQTPYSLGYVDIEPGVRVLSTVEAREGLAIDMPCHLVVEADGSWRFEGEQP